MKILRSFYLICAIGCGLLFGQDSLKGSRFVVSGYAELYYSFDLGRPADHLKAGCFYSYNRHNEVNVNLGFMQAAYQNTNVRGTFALMAGTYAQYNLSDEPDVFRHLLQANAGVRISKKKNIWFDAGIFPSHIGFESAIGKDSYVLTRSLLAENSPYYECGAKVTYISGNEQVQITGLYLNGWQHIQRPEGNQTPAFGTQFIFKPGDRFSFNWNTFFGNEKPDTMRQWRFFNNFYATYLSGKFGLIAGFDIGFEQASKDTSVFDTWYSPVLILHYRLNSKNRIALRGEYYSDEEQVIIVTGTANGFQTAGYSVNYDYSPQENVLIRIEARGLNSRDKIFKLDKKPSSQNFFFTAAACFSF